MDRVPGEWRLAFAATWARAGSTTVTVTVCAVVALVGWRYCAGADPLRIREIRFEGLSRATPEELLEISPVQRGDPLLFSDTDLVEAALRRHPWIASVEVRRRLPPALEVRVVERTPAAIVDLAGLYLVDVRGEVFKRAVPGDGLDLPVITGIARDDWIERRDQVEPLLTAALALLDRWAEVGLDRRAAVSEIHIDPEYGTTLWVGTEGIEVCLGHGDLPQKLNRLDRVLAALDAEGRRPEVLHLDNRRRPDWVAVRLAGRRGQSDGRSVLSGRGDPGGSSPR